MSWIAVAVTPPSFALKRAGNSPAISPEKPEPKPPEVPDPLPDYSVSLFRLAVEALDDLSLDPRYVIDMDCVHDPKKRRHGCSVNLAGAVMAVYFGADPSKQLYAFDMPIKTRSKFYDLERWSKGYLEGQFPVRDVKFSGLKTNALFRSLKNILHAIESQTTPA